MQLRTSIIICENPVKRIFWRMRRCSDGGVWRGIARGSEYLLGGGDAALDTMDGREIAAAYRLVNLRQSR